MLSRKWRCTPKQWESWSLSRNQRCVFSSWFLDRCKEAAQNKDDKTDVSHKMNIWSVAAPVFQAEGYTDGDLTLFHSFPITAFLKAENPVDFLAKASEVRSLGYGTASVAKSDKYLRFSWPDLLSYSDHLWQQRSGISRGNYQWNKRVLSWH